MLNTNKVPTSSSRIFTQTAALSLLEVLLAMIILAIAIIPIFHYTSHDAETILETDRIQQAENILESAHQEIISAPFDNFTVATEGSQEAGPFILASGFFPVTYDQVVQMQEKYKGFDLVGTWSYLIKDGKVDRTKVQVDYMVHWECPRGKIIDRKRSRLIVKP